MHLGPLPRFDEVHVVSDLHLGGAPGFQIFHEGRRLANTIRGLARRPARRVALVLNGDIVDFLAEVQAADGALYLDHAGALAKLQRIANDPSCADVWIALAEFVQTPHRHLVLVLGNHDVELALPHARNWLVDRLAGDDDSARGRLVLAMDGVGYVCEVGHRTVLCTHGNETDPWNVVDYRQLIHFGRAVSSGLSPGAWTPNAGTRLVIDVMNHVKREFPMVDLLKPETKAALPVVATLGPRHLRRIGKALEATMRRGIDGVRMRAGLLGEDTPSDDDRISEADALAELLSELDDADRIESDVEDDIRALQARIDANAEPLGANAHDATDAQLLGLIDRIRDKLGTAHPSEALRKVLDKWLTDDRTFDVSHADDQFKALDDEIGPEIDFVIAGHTHLRRALPRRTRDRYYFNSGTWIPLIQLSSSILKSQDAFRQAYDAFARGSIDALTTTPIATSDGKHHLLAAPRPTVVSIAATSGAVFGVLHDALEDGTLYEVPNTRFPSSS